MFSSKWLAQLLLVLTAANSCLCASVRNSLGFCLLLSASHTLTQTHTHTPRTSVCLIQTFLLVWICVWVYGESKQILKICSCVKCVFMSAAARRLAAMSNWNRLESFSRQIQWVEVKSCCCCCCCWIFCCRYLCSGKNKNLASLVSELYLSPPKPDLLCLHQGSLKR